MANEIRTSERRRFSPWRTPRGDPRRQRSPGYGQLPVQHKSLLRSRKRRDGSVCRRFSGFDENYHDFCKFRVFEKNAACTQFVQVMLIKTNGRLAFDFIFMLNMIEIPFIQSYIQKT